MLPALNARVANNPTESPPESVRTSTPLPSLTLLLLVDVGVHPEVVDHISVFRNCRPLRAWIFNFLKYPIIIILCIVSQGLVRFCFLRLMAVLALPVLDTLGRSHSAGCIIVADYTTYSSPILLCPDFWRKRQYFLRM